MKKYPIGLVLLAFVAACTRTPNEVTFNYQGNPLARHIFTADPTARNFDGTIYLYTSHDEKVEGHFELMDWRVLSSRNLKKWTDHGSFFGLNDIPWAKSKAWAPECVQRNGKYFFYYPVEQTMIGVAVSDNPTSGFVDSGRPIISNKGQIDSVGREPIDPTVLIDDDGQAYMYFGCRDFRMVRLKDNMIETEGAIEKPVIIGNEGDKEGYGGYYAEAPFVFKRNGIYYLVYSNGWSMKYSTLIYATADNPCGPFTYQGEVMENTKSGTYHGSLVEFKGQWYLFYHTTALSGGVATNRSVCFDKLEFDPDGRIIKVIPTAAPEFTNVLDE